VGKEKLVAQLRRNPLMRVLRVDKLTYSALEATLRAYLTERAFKEVPVLTMITATRQQIAERAEKFRKRLEDTGANKIKIRIVDGFSVIGGGSCPEAQLPTQLIALAATHVSATQIEERLRRSKPPIITRVEEDQVLIDLRTVLADQEDLIITACARL
jgi:L-seryl-tRNA(Ser) seleniumtransferase